MVLLRTAVERLLAMVFGLVSTVTLLQSLAVLVSVLAAVFLPVRSATPSWAIQPLILASLVCVTLMAGGILLGMIESRSGVKDSWGHVDGSLKTRWLLPATIPTLVLPAFGLFQSEPLFQLWREVFAATERFGGPVGLMKSPGAGLLLIPALAVLFVPILEAAAAFFLIATPPLLLALLALRSQRFRMESQRLVVIQWTLVGAAILGAALFGQLIELAAPHIKAAGDREGAIVMQTLAQGRQVVTGTGIAYAAMALVNALSLWILLAMPRAIEMDLGTIERLPDIGPASMLEETAPVSADPLPADPPAPPEDFQDVLARYRARHGQRP